MAKTKDLMLDCARRTLYVRGGEKVWDWKPMKVSDLDPAASTHDIRCAHCHGKLRLPKQLSDKSPHNHVEHFSRADSEGCRAGHYFAGTHRLSASPVV